MSVKGIPRLVFAVACVIVLAVYLLPGHDVYAAQITARSLTLQAGVSDGGSKPSGLVNHLFTFTYPSTNSVGSVQFLYCTTASGACTTPSGLSTTSATMGTETGNNVGFTLQSGAPAVNGAPYLTRTSASVTATADSYQLLGITNPDSSRCFSGANPQGNNCAFYVRISTFASTNATGSPIDTGVVAASTSTQITLTGTMPESLIFCTGGAVGTTSGVPDCSTANSGAVNFNQPFSPADTATATSQMSASTNAGSGYNITVNGPTLTSGSNTVTAMSTTGIGIRGRSQFGMNLRANTTTTSSTAVGTDVAPAANGTNYKGEPLGGYATVDNFRFASGESVADSANGGAGPSDSQIYTVSYIVNVNGAQAIGTYVSTLTYICTALF